MGWKNICNKIVEWSKRYWGFLKETVIPVIKTDGIMTVAFLRRCWKPFAIGAALVILIALMVSACFKLPSYVILANLPLILVFLTLVLALGVMIGFQRLIFRKLQRYIKKRQRDNDRKNEKPKTIQLEMKSRYELVSKVLIPIFGVIVGVSVLLPIWWQFRIQSDQLNNQAEIASKTLENAQFQVTAEQFNSAIINLGSENQAVVLGGIHALHHLAMHHSVMKSDVNYSKQVFEILCSFIREETRKPEYQARVLTENTPDKPNFSQQGTSRIVIQTIMNMLFREEDSGKHYQKYKANLNEAFLCGLDLVDMNLHEANLWRANLQGTNLKNANLQKANLREANLRETKLFRSDFRGAILCNADLRKAKLFDYATEGVIRVTRYDSDYFIASAVSSTSYFTQDDDLPKDFDSTGNVENRKEYEFVVYQRRNFDEKFQVTVVFEGADFSGANLQEAFLPGADLQRTKLINTNLQKAQLSYANLQGSNFSDTSLGETQLDAPISPILREAYLNFLLETQLINANLQGTNFQDVHLLKTELACAKLQGANFRYSLLDGANLSCANLQETDFRQAGLIEVNLDSANLVGVNFCEALLDKVNFTDANLQGVLLHGANLNEVNLRGTDLLNTDFRGVQNHRKQPDESLELLIDTTIPPDFFDLIIDATIKGTGLQTDISGLVLDDMYDDDGNMLNLDDNQKKEWLRLQAAKVDDFSAEEVQELFKKMLRESGAEMEDDLTAEDVQLLNDLDDLSAEEIRQLAKKIRNGGEEKEDIEVSPPPPTDE